MMTVFLFEVWGGSISWREGQREGGSGLPAELNPRAPPGIMT